MSYFTRINGQVFGPYDQSQLLVMRSKGKIARTTEISENKRDWKAAETFTFLYGAAHAAPQAFQSPVNGLVNRFHGVNVRTQDDDLVVAEESEPGSEFTFEMNLNGKRISGTRSKLFELARTGQVLPEDVVLIDGTKVFADAIKGIVFGDAREQTAPPLPGKDAKAQTQAPAFPNLGKKGELNSAPTTDESFYLVLPPRQRAGGLGHTLQNTWNLFSTSEEGGLDFNRIKPVCYTLGVICILGILGFFFWNSGWNKYGTINIEGTVTLDGEPIKGVSVILHPRDEKNKDNAAGGMTNKSGKFAVTTDIVVDPANPLRGTVPMVSGVMPGEYDVTFYKLEESGGILKAGDQLPKYLVPKRYGDVKTSGLKPIKVEPKGSRKFTFELTTAEMPLESTPD